jgi:predicted negative regulator of RcsB-dependent stress response
MGSLLLALLVLQPAAQASPREQYGQLMQQAREEVDRYAKSGAPRGAEADPRLRWAARLWELRKEHPRDPTAGHATRESLRLLLDAGRADEALARIDSLAPSDVAWGAGILTQLREASVQKGDPAVFASRATSLLAAAPDAEFRARVHFAIGRFHVTREERKEAEAAFEAAIAAGATTEFGKRAKAEIHELRALNLGQPAPAFAVRSLASKQVSNADLRGHATVFVYWASW